MSFFDDVEEPDNNRELQEGDYACEVFNTLLDLTKGRATIEYVIAEGVFKSFHIWCNYQISGKGKFFLKQDLGMFNINLSDIKEESDLADALHGLCGSKCNVKVKLTPKKDNPTQHWTNGFLQSVMVPGQESPPTLDEDDELGF